MEIIWSKEIDSILSRGSFLGGFGVNNWALAKHDAFDVIDLLIKLRIAIVGGDVFFRHAESARFESTYDNWYCNHENDENHITYIERCALMARNYIENYKPINRKEPWFVFVPKHII
jgi:hypothetical protein